MLEDSTGGGQIDHEDSQKLTFKTALAPNINPLLYDGEEYQEMKFVRLSAGEITRLTGVQHDQDEVFVGPVESMDHWQIVAENLGSNLKREDIRETKVVDAGMFARIDNSTIVIPSKTGSGELRTQDGEFSKMDRTKLHDLHKGTADFINRIYQESDMNISFSSP